MSAPSSASRTACERPCPPCGAGPPASPTSCQNRSIRQILLPEPSGLIDDCGYGAIECHGRRDASQYEMDQQRFWRGCVCLPPARSVRRYRASPAGACDGAEATDVVGVSSAGLSTMLCRQRSRAGSSGGQLQRVVPGAIEAITPIGSRRMLEVCSPEPVGTRLAVQGERGTGAEGDVVDGAGNVEPGGEPDRLARLAALGRSQFTATASSSAASRCIAVDRSAGVAPAQPGSAAFAAVTASCTSSTESRVSVVTTSPLAGWSPSTGRRSRHGGGANG